MKSCLCFEKTASSALIFATLSCFAAHFSPAQAAPAISTPITYTPIESAKPEFLASTDLSTVSETTEPAMTTPMLGFQTPPSDSDPPQPPNGEKASSLLLSPPPSFPPKRGEEKRRSLLFTGEREGWGENSVKVPQFMGDLGGSPGLKTSSTGDTLVEKTQLTVSELAETAPTNSLTQTETALTHLETNANSPDAWKEVKVNDVTTQPQLQAQSQPTHQANESQPPEAIPLDPLEEVQVDDSMGQVTNVTQLSDVRPTDWAYEALRSLVERYGCIAGYPDGTFRGNRAMSRYEFAAGVNACLQQIEGIIRGGGTNLASKQDLETLRRLVEEFQTELTAIGTRVDNLEARTTRLEDNQFSTTTKLFGQAIFGLQGRSENTFDFVFPDQRDSGTNINFVDNVQLSLFTQFGPRSLLLTGLAAGNGNNNAIRLEKYVSLGYESGNNNDLVLSDLNYRHLLTNKIALIFGPVGVNPVNVFRGVNRIESAGSGPISRFAQRNPIISIGGNGGGIGFDWQIATRLSFQGVYSANRSSDPNNGGIFGGNEGSTTAGAQLVASPIDNIDVSLQYINNYSPSGNLLTGVGDDILALNPPNALGFPRAPMQTNAFGLGLEWRVTPGFTFGGWGGYTTSDFKGGSGSVETFNWMAFLNFPDLLGEGNLAGIYVGQPPKITSSDLPAGRNLPSIVNRGDFFAGEGGQPDTTLHLEGFYRIRVTDNISLTPGVVVIFNPNHNDNNDTITIGALRTTFTF